MYFVKRNPDFKSISTFVRLYSLARKNYYEILNLRRNCTDKEIKEAFIQMSKEYHPDKNKDVRAQEKFVSIVEAYNVLGKRCSRAQYDSMYAMDTHTTGPYVYKTQYTYRTNPQYNNFYQNANSANNERAQTVNDAKVVRRVPNYVIIMMCCGIALVGSIFQGFVIREMYKVQRRQALEKSKNLAEELERVRAAAHNKTNEMQTRLLMEKIVTAANPAVATASLGHALANEKK